MHIANQEMIPTTALVVYENRGEHRRTGGMPRYYVETHSVATDSQGRHRLGEGSPITYKGLGELARAFREQADSTLEVSDVFPANLLYASQAPGSVKLVWYDATATRKWLGSGGLEIMAPSPTLLYCVQNGSLSVQAMDGPGRPEPGTKLYQVDWSNISGGGSVCLGNTKFNRHRPTFSGMVEEWTAAFWHSEFTGLSKGTAHYERLEKAARAKAPYPVAEHVFRQTFAQFAYAL